MTSAKLTKRSTWPHSTGSGEFSTDAFAVPAAPGQHFAIGFQILLHTVSDSDSGSHHGAAGDMNIAGDCPHLRMTKQPSDHRQPAVTAGQDLDQFTSIATLPRNFLACQAEAISMQLSRIQSKRGTKGLSEIAFPRTNARKSRIAARNRSLRSTG